MGWRNIDHVVVLMMENQSFDRILGWMTREEHDVDGADRNRSCPVDDPDFPGGPDVRVSGGASLIPPGAPHLPGHMFDQLHGDGPSTNRGFARQAYRTARKRGGRTPALKAEIVREVMRYHDPDALPVTRDLALNFAVADRWFCPIATSTWPNRYFLHYGTSPTGPLHIPQIDPRRPNIFQRLNDAGLPWRIYVDGPANVYACGAIRREARRARKRARKQGLSRYDAAHIRSFDRFLCDFSPTPDLPGCGRPQPLPTYTFIEPRHWGKLKNNDHSGTHMHRGQRLIATIYNQLRADPKVWERTLFIVTYDEHGGYHDHVGPPPAPHPDTGELGTVPKPGSMAHYGGRVPAILISPWIRPGGYHAVCDHTSILAFLERRFGLPPLTQRDARADDLTDAFQDEVCAAPARLDLPADPGAVADIWGGDDQTELELDLYRAMAETFGADADAEIAGLDPDAVLAVAEARAQAFVEAELADEEGASALA